MFPQLPSLNINLGGNQGIHGGRHQCGPRRGGGGPMMRMMQMMMQMMSQMMGGQQQGGCACHQGRPSFGGGQGGFQQPGININIGNSMRGFLG